MANNKRYTGSATLSISYNVSDYHPLDTRQLVPTYEALLLEDNWKHNGELNAYNGMIVAVGNEEANKGVYYLFDKDHPGAEDYPDVTKASNWYKLKLDSDMDGITEEQLEEAIKTLKSDLEKIYVKNDDAFAALKQLSSDNAAAIKALIANDADKSVREITKSEITSQIADTNSDLGGLAFRIGSAEEAIEALQKAGGVSEEAVNNMISTAVSNLDASYVIDNNSSYDIGYNETNKKQLIINSVNISKLHQDVEFILHGGSAIKSTFN